MSASGDVELTIQGEGKGTVLCYRSVMSTSAGIWLRDNPLHFRDKKNLKREIVHRSNTNANPSASEIERKERAWNPRDLD